MVFQALLWLVPCGVVYLFMMSGRGGKSQQSKVISLFLVIGTVGVLLVTTSYNGLLRNPLHVFEGNQQTQDIGSNVNVVKAQTEYMHQDNAAIEGEIRQHTPERDGGGQQEDNSVENSEEKDVEKSVESSEESGDLKTLDTTGGNIAEKDENVVAKNDKNEQNAIEKAEDVIAVAKEVEVPSNTGDEKGDSVKAEPEYFYGVMFDAGSTGSRVHAFKFKDAGPGKPFLLEDALFKFNSEGLSSFADEPAEGVASISKLLDEAKAYVPQSQWPQTPLALKATAGLRALPQEQSDALLKEVSKLFADSQFKVGADAVTIMDGDEEGIFSWFTLNFLMGVLGDAERMVGAMDLGGGSTQITFVTTPEANKAEYVEEMDIFGKKFSLYTHSYLGLGLMAGRFQTLGGKEPASEETGPFKTPCIASGKTVQFQYQGEVFNVTGTDIRDPANRFSDCQKLTDAVVQAGNIDKPPQVHQLPFTIFSYYYDRAVDANLIDESKGGDIKVKDFINAARRECEVLQGKDFLCLDLTYITSLLTTGFNYYPDTPIALRKRVDNFEISWALGAMFHLLKQ